MFILAVPLLQGWLRGNPRKNHYAWIAIGFMPFVIGIFHLDASIISWGSWPGYVKGMLVSLLDAVALAVILSTRPSRIATPFLGLIVAYMLIASISIANAGLPEAAFFYTWQLARALLLFVAVSRIATRPNGARYVILGMICAAILQGGYTINERLHGVAQAGGTLGNQNLLGMMLHFALYPALALLIADRRQRLPLFGVAGAIIAVVLTGSRATIGLAGIGVVLLIVLSLIRRPSGWKAQIATFAMLAVAVAAPIAYGSLQHRLQSGSADSSDEERAAFKRAAWMMLADHPMGVGANQYVIVANTEGYSERAGVVWNFASRATNVHNTYLLVAAETGYQGVAAFIALMILPIIAAMRFAWADRRDPRGDLMLGLAVTLIAVAMHCQYEWIFVVYPVQYLFAICLGLVAGLIQQRKIEQRGVRRGRSLPIKESALTTARAS